MQVCFIGHRNIQKSEEVTTLLKQTVANLIKTGATTFLFGSMSEFDSLSWKVVTELKEIYPFIKRVYVRSAYQYIDKSYEAYLLKSYEETYFPIKLKNAGRYSYVERNCEMIDSSVCCVFYYNEKYVAQSTRQSARNALFSTIRNSGTKIAYDYAVKKNKIIINLYEQDLHK